MDIIIYHNPRCSKSRQTLALIEAAGVSPQIIRYLETPLTNTDIKTLLKKLGMDHPQELMRKGEAIYKQLALKNETDKELLINAMAENPKLIERPIVVKGEQAILGRPPENVKALLGV